MKYGKEGKERKRGRKEGRKGEREIEVGEIFDILRVVLMSVIKVAYLRVLDD